MFHRVLWFDMSSETRIVVLNIVVVTETCKFRYYVGSRITEGGIISDK